MDDITREVKLGDTTVQITRFRGLKAILAGGLVARVTEQVPDLQERITKFQKDYRKNNTIEINRGMAKLPDFAAYGFTDADFESFPDGIIALPQEPTPQAVMISVVPQLYALVKEEFVRFLGLMTIPNSELEAADDADAVDEALKTKGKQILRLGDIDEVLEVFLASWEVLQDQLLAKKERLGKLQNLPFLRGLLSTGTEEETEQEENPIQPIFPEESHDLSDSSEQNTTGAEETHSTEPLGVN